MWSNQSRTSRDGQKRQRIPKEATQKVPLVKTMMLLQLASLKERKPEEFVRKCFVKYMLA